MNWPEIYLICFGVGSLWSLVSLLAGGLHLGHFGHGHGHIGSGHAGHGHLHAGHSHAGHSHSTHGHSDSLLGSWLGSLLNPGCLAIFLAWFGGCGYLLTRHSSFGVLPDAGIAALAGLAGAFVLAAFLRWLQAHEQPLDPADDDMIGVLGRVSSTIRPDGVGEVIYERNGVRRAVAARPEEGYQIGRGVEVIVTRYEKGIAFVRTWEAMTQPGHAISPQTLPEERN
jgi:membrane protein implicated in regulation of membrane protease activity